MRVQDARIEVTDVTKKTVDCQSPSEKDLLCMFWLKVAMDVTTKRWWLILDSITEHNNHPQIWPETQLAGESDLTPNQMEFIQQFYDHRVIPSTIADYRY